MKCFNCDKTIVENAAFCPYCGDEISHKTICFNCKNNIPIESEYCPFCGEIIHPTNENKNKKQEINKQDIKPLFVSKNNKSKNKPSKQLICLIAVAVLAFVLGILNVVQLITSKSAKEQIEKLNIEIQQRDKTIEVKDSELNEYKPYESMYEESQDELDFLKKKNEQLIEDSFFLFTYIGIVYDDGTDYYHRSNCTHHSSDDFVAYNTTQCEARGYKKCPYCYK